MPGMKGDEFLRRVKSDHPAVRAILVTGHAEDSTIDSLLRDGVADGVVMKPWRSADLMRHVDRCLEGSTAV
jgi:CheY-like chemotaxis protein